MEKVHTMYSHSLNVTHVPENKFNCTRIGEMSAVLSLGVRRGDIGVTDPCVPQPGSDTEKGQRMQTVGHVTQRVLSGSERRTEDEHGPLVHDDGVVVPRGRRLSCREGPETQPENSRQWQQVRFVSIRVERSYRHVT